MNRRRNPQPAICATPTIRNHPYGDIPTIRIIRNVATTARPGVGAARLGTEISATMEADMIVPVDNATSQHKEKAGRLICHWVVSPVTGRPECRWTIDTA